MKTKKSVHPNSQKAIHHTEPKKNNVSIFLTILIITLFLVLLIYFIAA
ncbi:MAG: autophagy-related protein 27 [Saprospiraceae bacterium]|jgi:hypothetical protein|nr:autophagy-related protein 27 [Saprospiraceae bacterium]MDP4809727.1 autophagy-related protein 27 [Saprospiraceae bacterium]MDP4815768.1 autophagy-related protein 27 [Saprospiraceae bacterium]MDP4915910.1 autophagy-related protein 27 [Saprospiraceae bacterium]MDP5047069.1 autophagy-related protein 27 [Saprospiraceae bacterium]